MKHNYSNVDLRSTGIYKITCIVTGKFYIGSASCLNGSPSKIGFRIRIQDHSGKLNRKYHNNPKLQNAWNKYGSDNFIFEIIELCDPKDCAVREQYYLDTLNPFDNNGFNICKTSLNAYNKKTTKVRSYNRDNSKVNHHLRKPVLCFNSNGKLIAEYLGISEASRVASIQRTAIYNCCQGKGKTAGGFIWEYKNPEDLKPKGKRIKYHIKVTNLLDNSTIIYKTQKEVCISLDYCRSTIRIHCDNGLPLENKFLFEKIIL